MKTRLALGALALSALSLPGIAGGGGPFAAEIACGGLVIPPAQVP
jgi:hypothetical protein